MAAHVLSEAQSIRIRKQAPLQYTDSYKTYKQQNKLRGP
jgi:hypothetical protein